MSPKEMIEKKYGRHSIPSRFLRMYNIEKGKVLFEVVVRSEEIEWGVWRKMQRNYVVIDGSERYLTGQEIIISPGSVLREINGFVGERDKKHHTFAIVGQQDICAVRRTEIPASMVEENIARVVKSIHGQGNGVFFEYR